MKVKISDDFVQKLNNQIEYIARDKPVAARKLKLAILTGIKKLARHPYSARRSIYFEDESIREMIIKGYKIIYRVESSSNEMVVFGFIRSQNTP